MSTLPGIVSKRFDELTALELHDLLRLRCNVFVVEQACAYAEIDGRDTEPATLHHWMAVDGEIVAYLRELSNGEARRIGRVVTSPSARGRGFAAALMRHAGAAISTDVVLDAQSYLVGWYEDLGYRATGPEFIDDGIAHIPMRRVGRSTG